eukprot:gene7212-14708_t
MSQLMISCFLIFSLIEFTCSIESDKRNRVLGQQVVDDRLHKARSLSEEAINLIHHRYEMGNKTFFQLFQVSANMPSFAWDILKNKFALKILSQDSKFLMIFGGSSVTAGHDNLLNQSYPFVIERYLSPIFKELGIELIVRNIAQGANQCRPYEFCYWAMGGEDPDWIGWEQSFNCGRDATMLEYIARVAGWTRAVLYFSASGGFKTSECTPSKDPVPWISDKWSPQTNMPPLPQYTPNITQIHHLKGSLNKWYQDGSSVGRFTEPLTHPDYKSVGAHGFNVWGISRSLCVHPSGKKGCTGAEVRGPCYENGGPHWVTSEASVYGKGRGASHHPPVGMHLLRGESLVWLYAHILLDAMVEVQRVLSEGGNETVFQHRLDVLQPPLPPPKTCSPWCDRPPVCYTNFMPHYNENRTLENLLVNNDTKWKLIVPDHSNHDYLDLKPYYKSPGPGHEIHFKIDVNSNKGIVYVCCSSYKDALLHAIFTLDEHQVDSSSSYTPSPHRKRHTDVKHIGDDCMHLSNISRGHHILSVSQDPLHAQSRHQASPPLDQASPPPCPLPPSVFAPDHDIHIFGLFEPCLGFSTCFFTACSQTTFKMVSSSEDGDIPMYIVLFNTLRHFWCGTVQQRSIDTVQEQR